MSTYRFSLIVKLIALAHFLLAIVFFGQFFIIDKVPIGVSSLFTQSTDPYFVNNLVAGSVSAIIALFTAYKIWQGLMFGWLLGLISIATFYLNEMGLVIIKSIKINPHSVIVDSVVIGVFILVTYLLKEKFQYGNNFLGTSQRVLIGLVVIFRLAAFIVGIYL